MLGLQKSGAQEHGTIVFMFSFFGAEGITCQQLNYKPVPLAKWSEKGGVAMENPGWY